MAIETYLRGGLWRVRREGGGEISSHIDRAAAIATARRVALDERLDVVVRDERGLVSGPESLRYRRVTERSGLQRAS